MQEIGPRFTLRVKKIYAGEEEKVKGLEFEARDNMYVERKAAYLWFLSITYYDESDYYHFAENPVCLIDLLGENSIFELTFM